MAVTTLQENIVYHERLIPFNHKFFYRVFTMCLDVNDIDFNKTYLLSHNKFNLFSFYDIDYIDKSQQALATKLKNFCSLQGFELNQDDKIELTTMPRVFGYVFNPVSFWRIKNKEGELKLVIAEVNNTFGDRHFYFLNPHGESKKILAQKEFHVSPFFDRKGEYQFSFTNKKTAINYFDNESSQFLFLSSLTFVKSHELKDQQLLKILFKFPFQPFLVVAKIHWQALLLYLKGAVFFKRPEPKSPNVTKELF